MRLMRSLSVLHDILLKKEDFPDESAHFREKSSFRSYVFKLSDELGAAGRLRTARAYRSTLNSVLSFCGTKDVSLQKITRSFVQEYEVFLKNRDCSLNTISFYMRNLRAMLNKAVVEEILQVPVKNLFSGVFTGNAQTDKRAISKNEIQQIRNWTGYEEDKRNGDALFLAKLYFLFSFFMRGMSFIDMAYLKKSDIRDEMISYVRKKTGQSIHVQMTPDLKRIIAYVEKQTGDSEYLLPIISRQDKPERLQYQTAMRNYNNQLKKIQTALGISKKLTGYVARHSWATIAKHMHVPIEQISESLGHTNIKTTMIYLANFNQSTLHKINLKVTV